MVTRRQEKVARVVKEVVCNSVAHHLSDPRIEGFVSVTRVDIAPDLRNADVYLSVFGKNTAAEKKTFTAVVHAKSRIQSLLANKLQCKFCPVLRFHKDDNFKKTLDTMNLIYQATNELEEKDSLDDESCQN